MASLTGEEKSRVRHHLGFLGVQVAQTFVFNFPTPIETQFAVEGAMDRVLEDELPQVRRHLAILDKFEQQMIDDVELMAINRIDTIEVNQKEQAQLLVVYDYWRKSLANLFGVTVNPSDQRFMGGMGVNVVVTG